MNTCLHIHLLLKTENWRPGTRSESLCHSDPLGLPQVNDSVEFLGERKGYAPFSPDENSLVLFDGRAI